MWRLIPVIFLLFALGGVGNSAEKPSLKERLFKGSSITPILPLIKFQKRERFTYEALSNAGVTLNVRAPDLTDSMSFLVFTGPLVRLIPDNWYWSWMSGLSLIDTRTKCSYGVGLSVDICGTYNGEAIGILSASPRSIGKDPLKYFGLLLFITPIPSQSRHDPEALIAKAVEKQTKGDYPGAYALYSKALKLDPDNARALSGLYQTLKVSNNASLTLERVRSYFEKGDTNKAKVFFDLAGSQRQNPMDAAVFGNMKNLIPQDTNGRRVAWPVTPDRPPKAPAPDIPPKQP